MEKNSFLDLSKEVKLAIFYSISSELAGKDKEIKTFILSFFLNIHKFSIENMLNNTSISKIISNLVFMKNSTIDKDYLKNEILEACKIKKK
jgi:hypothetical protein